MIGFKAIRLQSRSALNEKLQKREPREQNEEN
jgi:hypothetical protein